MFYAAAGREPIYFELGLKVGDRIAIFHYKTAATMIVNRIGYTTATFKQLESEREVPDYGKLQVEDYNEQNNLIEDFLSEVFCEQHNSTAEWRYNLSVAVAEKLITGDYFQGLMYPTVPMWGHADKSGAEAGVC